MEKTLCCWFCTSGPVSITARTDRRGYCPGSHTTMNQLMVLNEPLCMEYVTFSYILYTRSCVVPFFQRRHKYYLLYILHIHVLLAAAYVDFASLHWSSHFVGESIQIFAEFNNHSSRTVTPHATLYQSQIFFAGNKSKLRRTKFCMISGILCKIRKNTVY